MGVLVAFFVYFSPQLIRGDYAAAYRLANTRRLSDFYLLLMSTLVVANLTAVAYCCQSGVTVLIWTTAIDHTLVLTERAVSPKTQGRLRDRFGRLLRYRSLISGMLLKENRTTGIYSNCIIMLVMMLLTQSRGPLISLAIAVVALCIYISSRGVICLLAHCLLY